jgi:ABC-type cobalamin/Fe3+-siderophores transport system ATPase subunit
MSETSVFRFDQARFQFGESNPVQVVFVADDNRKAKTTHFTLLMGANGTCKSRILSCCVNLLKGIKEREGAQPSKKGRFPYLIEEQDRDLRCTEATITRDGLTSDVGNGPLFESGDVLPSRVLAIANLVRDRFTFTDWEDFDDPFYYYLGVRQASNLTTTGAMERLVCDAVITILSDAEKFDSFSKWTQKLFPRTELGLSFARFSPSSFDRFFEAPAEWLRRQRGPARSDASDQKTLERLEPHMKDIKALGDLLFKKGQDLDSDASLSMKRGGALSICLNQLSVNERVRLGRLNQALKLAQSVRLIGRPSLLLRSHGWLDFTQLSSGEQNLVATGARLLAFSAPGSMVVIDEPEVSLNIAWQQRYIELISDALVHAKGSHVFIASHSPYLISDLRAENSTIVVAQRGTGGLTFRSQPGEFWGWGSEAILYEVLGLPSASNYHFSRELAGVLKLVSEKSTDAKSFAKFLRKCEQLDFGSEAEPLKVVIEEIRNYAGGLHA